MEIRKYWEIFVRRKWIFIQAVVVFLAVSLLICFIPKRIYSISAKLQITAQDLQPQFVGDMPANFGRINATSPALNEVETLQSDGLIAQVIKELDLKDKSGEPYSPQKFTNPGFLTIVFQKIGVKISNPEDTDIIEISGISTEPEQAVNIANGLVQRYLALKSLTNRQEAKKAIAYITQQLPLVKAELTRAEEIQQTYIETEHLANIETQRTNLANQLDNLNGAVLAAKRTLTADEKRRQAIKAELAQQPELQQATVNTEANPILQSLKSTLYGLERDLAQLLTQYTEEHPDVKSKREQIAQTKSQIKEQVEKTFANSGLGRNPYYDSLIQSYGNNEIELVVTKANLEVLQNQINEVTAKLDALDRKALELSRLDRITVSLRNRYNTLLSQLQTAKLAEQMEVTNAVLLSAAEVPKSKTVLKSYIYFPKRKWVMIIGAFFGVAFGLFLVYFIEYLDDRIYREEQIRTITDLPILSVIPQISQGISSITALPPAIQEKFADLAMLLGIKNSSKRIAIMSINKQEGKSFVTAALGIAFARSGKKTILVDGNIKSPQLAQLFQIATSQEMGPVATAVEGLDILSRFPQSVLTQPENLKQYLETLSQTYQMVLFDTAALTESTVARVIAPYTDTVVLVIGSGMSTVTETKQWLADLTSSQSIAITGIIVNRVS
ncbi:MAG: polysaccharide biosynthesis tyrosine autokinase [bacterium]|nr:polysaccharide biosynthesis tyrosine autokinase [bacterium]